MNRNHDLDRRVLVDTEKIGMHNLVLVGMTLQITQNNFLCIITDLQLDDLGVNRFVFEFMNELVVLRLICTGSLSPPYTIAGTRPWCLRRRLAPFPESERGSAFR